jgi:hypothetical protein
MKIWRGLYFIGIGFLMAEISMAVIGFFEKIWMLSTIGIALIVPLLALAIFSLMYGVTFDKKEE